MPRQDVDRDTTWVLAEPNRTWTLGPYATISTETGILDTTEGSQIRILGGVFGNDADVGVQLGSGTSSVLIGRSGAIEDVDIGIALHPNGGIVENSGLINVDRSGIEGERGIVRNSGQIFGEFGVFFTLGGFVIENGGLISGFWGVAASGPGGTIVNAADGEISGGAAISLEGAGTTSIINDGVLRGYVAAIQCDADASVDVVNRGAIVGDLLLSAREDRVDTRGGTIRGVIHGGNGDDVYLISDSNIRISDNGSSFFDAVRSSASYTITGGLDDLHLTGKANIFGFGNGGHNDLVGNMGRNVLSGDAGDDRLVGRKGNDQMSGGAGADVFEFSKGDGHDRIADFEEMDSLSSGLVRNERDFARLNVRQVGDDVIIDFGQGDKLTLLGFNRADLDYADFVPSV
jgi:Ca2+-binding RTX toxin-like protein